MYVLLSQGRSANNNVQLLLSEDTVPISAKIFGRIFLTRLRQFTEDRSVVPYDKIDNNYRQIVLRNMLIDDIQL